MVRNLTAWVHGPMVRNMLNTHTFSGFARLLLALTLSSTIAAAQSPPSIPGTISEEIVLCASIEGDSTRLACYDRSVEALIGESNPEQDDAAHAFVGEGDWTSEVVQMSRPWQVTWQSAAAMLTIELRTADNQFVSLVGSQVGEGEGRTNSLDPGDYRINVSAFNGEWRLLLMED